MDVECGMGSCTEVSTVVIICTTSDHKVCDTHEDKMIKICRDGNIRIVEIRELVSSKKREWKA